MNPLLDFAPRTHKQPQTEGLPETEGLRETEGLPVAELTALAPRDGLEMPVENLDDLVDRVFEKSKGEIDRLIEEFERLRKS